MQTAKGATAYVTEKVQNAQAKADKIAESNKAAAVEKADRKTAENKAEKHKAKAKRYEKEAEIQREYDQKLADHAAEKEQKKEALHQKKVEKEQKKEELHQKKADKHAKQDAVSDSKLDKQSTTPSPHSDSLAPGPTEVGAADTDSTHDSIVDTEGDLDDELDNQTSSTPAPSDDNAQEDIIEPNSTPASPVVEKGQVPMHGSGVPTHSTLHQDRHDVRTTQVMGASPNTGSYM